MANDGTSPMITSVFMRSNAKIIAYVNVPVKAKSCKLLVASPRDSKAFKLDAKPPSRTVRVTTSALAPSTKYTVSAQCDGGPATAPVTLRSRSENSAPSFDNAKATATGAAFTLVPPAVKHCKSVKTYTILYAPMGQADRNVTVPSKGSWTSATVTFADMKPGTMYTFRARAVCSGNKLSGHSPVGYLKTMGEPGNVSVVVRYTIGLTGYTVETFGNAERSAFCESILKAITTYPKELLSCKVGSVLDQPPARSGSKRLLQSTVHVEGSTTFTVPPGANTSAADNAAINIIEQLTNPESLGNIFEESFPESQVTSENVGKETVTEPTDIASPPPSPESPQPEVSPSPNPQPEISPAPLPVDPPVVPVPVPVVPTPVFVPVPVVPSPVPVVPSPNPPPRLPPPTVNLPPPPPLNQVLVSPFSIKIKLKLESYTAPSGRRKLQDLVTFDTIEQDKFKEALESACLAKGADGVVVSLNVGTSDAQGLSVEADASVSPTSTDPGGILSEFAIDLKGNTETVFKTDFGQIEVLAMTQSSIMENPSPGHYARLIKFEVVPSGVYVAFLYVGNSVADYLSGFGRVVVQPSACSGFLGGCSNTSAVVLYAWDNLKPEYTSWYGGDNNQGGSDATIESMLPADVVTYTNWNVEGRADGKWGDAGYYVNMGFQYTPLYCSNTQTQCASGAARFTEVFVGIEECYGCGFNAIVLAAMEKDHDDLFAWAEAIARDIVYIQPPGECGTPIEWGPCYVGAHYVKHLPIENTATGVRVTLMYVGNPSADHVFGFGRLLVPSSACSTLLGGCSNTTAVVLYAWDTLKPEYTSWYAGENNQGEVGVDASMLPTGVIPYTNWNVEGRANGEWGGAGYYVNMGFMYTPLYCSNIQTQCASGAARFTEVFVGIDECYGCGFNGISVVAVNKDYNNLVAWKKEITQDIVFTQPPGECGTPIEWGPCYLGAHFVKRLPTENVNSGVRVTFMYVGVAINDHAFGFGRMIVPTSTCTSFLGGCSNTTAVVSYAWDTLKPEYTSWYAANGNEGIGGSDATVESMLPADVVPSRSWGVSGQADGRWGAGYYVDMYFTYTPLATSRFTKVFVGIDECYGCGSDAVVITALEKDHDDLFAWANAFSS